jgi:hypothetical protein
MTQTPTIIRLQAATLEPFLAYIGNAEQEMQSTFQPGGGFLWSEQKPEREGRILDGRIEAELWSGAKPIGVPDGLIHDWVGAAFAPNVTVERTLELVQDYDNHKQIYKPEVVDSRLISRDGNDFQIYLRLLKKKMITVVLDTDHAVRYSQYGTGRWFCRSYTTRIAEVENAGTANEQVMPPDNGHGFLWRLYSYWRFEEKNGGVFLECRAISLSRDIPFGLGWIIEPIIRRLPKESLINTLAATRKALGKN